MSNTFTRQEALESLYRITFTESPETPKHVKAKEYIKTVLSSKGVPDEVSLFLSEETSVGYASDFFTRLKSKKFMRTLKSLDSTSQLPNEVIVKAINSLVTHAVIDIELGNASRQVVTSNLKIDELLEIVRVYFETGQLAENTQSVVRNLLSKVN